MNKNDIIIETISYNSSMFTIIDGKLALKENGLQSLDTSLGLDHKEITMHIKKEENDRTEI